MKIGRKRQIEGLLVATMLVCMVFVTTVSAENSMAASSEMNKTYTKGNVEITLDKNENMNSAKLKVTSNESTYNYRVNLSKSESKYIAKIYNSDGKLINKKYYSSNPLFSSENEEPIIIQDIIVDANIDIYPGKYSYNVGEYGTVNVVVDNYAAPDGSTNYYLRIPKGIDYINVYDGKEPSYVYNLPTSNDYVFIPEKGRVYGPATVLYWQDLHTFGYNEHIKVQVKYSNNGSFKLYAYDHDQEILSGWPAWDDDQFYSSAS
ncbi:hypothetical protein Metev_1096 [Methanohalobium evestigatum Z-7303]|uniref:Uncharacterized protein n=1 Tax=Methanohalobium evestigatum (strain ATCC BAA-1072 / DSM 3721 / NBRC 107634 / OCM 161 / Z-7303) TaxID=644295 RepID=D7E931_METEZ|nr:hypothetical protein [Methanohalobium evestigatum]ADI73979.1 hypothetical protein Metev_1096 [Methanohalobium evestigatum Z-7303]